MSRVLGRTGWRGPGQPVITVGGTNGKGSCVALLEALLRAGGYRVGTFTSPHLVDYRERIRLDGAQVSEASLVAAFERIADALDGDSLTFFEFNTLAALLVFETWAPDAIVLEVGLGGRLDAVNIVDADVAIVVSVALDHMEWLGPDLESIGREKAGIFRRARPAVCGMAEPPRALSDVAEQVGAPLLLRGRDFDAVEHADGRWDFRDAHGELTRLPAPALEGVAQTGNAATALAALRQLADRLPLDRAAIESGLARACDCQAAFSACRAPAASSGCSTSRTIQRRRQRWPQIWPAIRCRAGPLRSAACSTTRTSAGCSSHCAIASIAGSPRRPRGRGGWRIRPWRRARAPSASRWSRRGA